jgi:hypothetical protein
MQESIEGKKTGMDRLELIALGASSAVIVVAIVYWTMQISGVLDMLELAYG